MVMRNKEVEESISENEQAVQDCQRLPLRIGNTTYLIGVFSADTATETLDEKVKKMIQKDLQNGNL